MIAIAGLQKASTARIKELFIDRLKNDECEYVRIEAAQGLAAYKDSDVVKTMLECLKVDTDEDVRAKIAYALSGIGNSSIISILESLLDSETDWVRWNLQSTINTLNNKRA